MKYTNNFDVIGRSSVIDYMASNRKFSIALFNVITDLTQLRVVSQLMKCIIKLSQVFIALVDAPTLLRKFSNTYQVIFGSVGE